MVKTEAAGKDRLTCLASISVSFRYTRGRPGAAACVTSVDYLSKPISAGHDNFRLNDYTTLQNRIHTSRCDSRMDDAKAISTNMWCSTAHFSTAADGRFFAISSATMLSLVN